MSPDCAPLRKPARALLLSAFFLSGAASLAYEVAWSRALLLLLGSTAAASAVVLGTFVGALGLGARWAGAVAERSRRPLRLYGLFEIGAAVWAVLAPLLVLALAGPYVAVAAASPGWLQTVLRVLVAAVVVAPAAFLLGATLPAMVRHWVRATDDTGRQTAWLYGVNTLGALAGCLLTGYVGIAHWGVRGVVWAAAVVGTAVGLAAWVAGRRPLAVTAKAPRAIAPRGGGGRKGLFARFGRIPVASWVAFLCGFIGLATEVVGFRTLIFFVEGFTVTFASMLGVFIAGLGVGSLVLGPTLARTARPARALGVLLVLQALALLIGLYGVIPCLEGWMRAIRGLAYAGARSPADIAAGLRLASLLGAGLLLFVPALLMGPTFPLCVRWAELRGESPGQAVGRTYLFNSAGSLLAPLVVTFLVIPLFHVPGAWILVIALAGACGLALWHLERRGRAEAGGLRLAALLGCAVAVGVLVLDVPGTRARDLLAASPVLRGRPGRELLLVRSDAVTTASVIQTREGERTLYTDEFAAAATGRHYRYMRMLGHLPVVLADRPRRAMVIAFGTGTTAGAVAQHEELEHIEVVEVSSAVLDLADFFVEANRLVLNDERVDVIRDDGRNALLLHASNLDVITLEPLMPYSPQGYPFYTREFYELARDRLTDGGVLCQWLPVHAMPVGLYAAFLRTFFEVFPEGSLWFFEQSTALIGRKGKAAPDATSFLQRLLNVDGDLRDAGFERPWLLLSGYLARGEDVLRLPAPPDYERFRGRPVVDMDPYAEFQPTPRAPLSTPYLHQTLRYLFSLVEPDKQPTDRSWWQVEDGAALRRGTQTALAARWKDAEAEFLAVATRALPAGSPARREREALERRTLEDAALGYRNALVDLPGDRVLAWRLVRAWRRLARPRVLDLMAQAAALRTAGKGGEAREALVLAESVARAALPPALTDPDPVATGRIDAAALHAAVLLRLGRCAQAERVLSEARADLGDQRREAPLDRLLAGVAAHAAGETAEPGPDWRWVFVDAAPCREEGIAPVREAFERYAAAGSAPAELRVERSRAQALLEAARREGVEAAVSEALRGLPAPAQASPRVLRAVVLRQLEPGDAQLGDLLRSEDSALRRVALVEAGWWGLLASEDEVLDAALRDEDPLTRRALAQAAVRKGEPALLRRVVELLMDPDPSVRVEAFSVFAGHRPDVVDGYDPNGPEEARRAIYEKARRGLN